MKKTILTLTFAVLAGLTASYASAQPQTSADQVKQLTQSFSESDVFYNVDSEKDYNAKAFSSDDADGTVKCWFWYYRPTYRLYYWRPVYYRPAYYYYRYYTYRTYFRWSTYVVYKGLSKGTENGNAAILDADPDSGSPFAAHGLRKGDVITAIDGKPVTSLADLNQVTANSKLTVQKGNAVKFAGNLLKNANESTIKDFNGQQEVEAGTLLTKAEVKSGNYDMYQLYSKGTSEPVFGVKAADNTDNNGVKVTEVLPNLPGAKSGFEVNDVILEINGEKITGEKNYSDAIDRAGKVARMKVLCRKTGQTIDTDVILNK
ncbi:MAG: PDZ domain-containing protein [Planctomycetaceae bacterium]|jgi:C-terminal processing protease CtpA/Prc|nr:PDZ domain-containing protein [Planctomycetaceae bacterium]